MTKEEIQRRKGELIDNREKVMGQANALTGAIQDCDYWLAQLERKEKLTVAAEIEAARKVPSVENLDAPRQTL